MWPDWKRIFLRLGASCWILGWLAADAMGAAIILGSTPHLKLSEFRFYEDPTGLMTVHDVLRPAMQDLFQDRGTTQLGRGYTESHYWLAFAVDNRSSTDTWYLIAAHPLVWVEVYRLEPDGTTVQEPQRDERHAVSQLHAPRNQVTHFLIHARSMITLSLDFQLLTEPALERDLQNESLFLSFLSGCFVAMILYNCFLYLSLRDKDYLFYLFFAVTNSHVALMTVNFPAGIWGWLGIPWWDIINVYRLLTPLTTLLFARSFLQLPSAHPRLNRAFIVCIAGLGALAMANAFLARPLLMNLMDVYFFGAIGLLVFAGYYRLKQAFTPALYYLAGLAVFLSGVVICLLLMLGVLPTHPWTVNALVVAEALEMILMSLALGGKVKLLQAEKMRAEVTAQVKGHLLRIISHDIANPLTVVKTYAHRLQHDNAESRPVQNIVRGVGMIEEILNFVRRTEAVNQGMSMRIGVIALDEIFARLLFLFEERARDKGIRLDFHLERPDLAVQAEKTSLSHEVLGNLLSNAIKFSRPGGVVYLGASDQGDGMVLITVRDQGIGMSPEVLARLFDPSQNRSQPGTAGEQGVGYGMPLAKALLDAFAAKIEVDSIPIEEDAERCGTIFRIFIRAAYA